MGHHTKYSYRGVLRFFVACGLIAYLVAPDVGRAQQPPESVPTATPIPPTATPCADLSRPQQATPHGPKTCPVDSTKLDVNGEERCVASCGAGQKTEDINCSNRCAPCSARCLTCAYNRIEFKNLATGGRGRPEGLFFNSEHSVLAENVFKIPAGSLECLTKNRDAGLAAKGDDDKYRDDRIFRAILASFQGLEADARTLPGTTYSKSSFCHKADADLATFNSPYKFLNCSYQCPPGGQNPATNDCFAVTNPNHGQEVHYGSRCTAFPNQRCVELSSSCRHFEGLCTTGSFVVDSSCNPVPLSELNSLDGKQCIMDLAATLSFRASSPISLLWDGASELHHKAAFVHFPLDLSGTDKWYAWYASDTAPLLVYDPHHLGDINSAQQLFGNWSFGGRRVARQVTAGGGQPAEPWRDGYEALATLDQNGDQQISGNELQPLALWFDSNRDGISQRGEVKPIRSLDVHRLYLGPTSRNELTKHVSVKVGFERLINGVPKTGATVDWYGQGGDSLTSLVAKQQSRDQFNQADSIGALTAQSIPSLPIAHGRLAENSRVSGDWIWYGAGESSKDAQGIITLAELEGRGIQGISMSNAPVESSLVPARGVINFTMVNGQISAQDEQKVTLRFSSIGVIAGSHGVKPSLETEATLDLKTGTMSGTTTQRFMKENDYESVTYRWQARRQR